VRAIGVRSFAVAAALVLFLCNAPLARAQAQGKSVNAPAAVMADVNAQLSPAERADFEHLLRSMPRRSRTALVDFLATLHPQGADGPFVSQLVQNRSVAKARILGFLALLTPAERDAVAGSILIDSDYEGDQWHGFFGYVGARDPKAAKAEYLNQPRTASGAPRAMMGPADADQPLKIVGGCSASGACTWSVEPWCCGVTNGTPAPKIPWQVELYRTGNSATPYNQKDIAWEVATYGLTRSDEHRNESCGGVLIPGNWVLTAAHCAKPFKDNPREWILANRRVRTGTNSLVSGGTTWVITAIVTHSGYGKPGNGRSNDIALLKIEADGQTRLADNDDAHPIDLPPANAPVPDGATLTVTGWGVTAVSNLGQNDAKKNPQVKSSLLLEANVTKVPVAACNANLNYHGPELRDSLPIGPGEICALGADHKDSCEGDSGGPLVHAVGGWVRLVGLVSFGPGCGMTDTPSVYTDVAYYRDWIDEAMKQAKTGKVREWPELPAQTAARR
jgi:hypothetical protein